MLTALSIAAHYGTVATLRLLDVLDLTGDLLGSGSDLDLSVYVYSVVRTRIEYLSGATDVVADDSPKPQESIPPLWGIDSGRRPAPYDERGGRIGSNYLPVGRSCRRSTSRATLLFVRTGSHAITANTQGRRSHTFLRGIGMYIGVRAALVSACAGCC